MPNKKKGQPPQPALKYRQLPVTDLDRRRRGKHHDLVEGILDELKGAPVGSPLEIPLDDVGGIGLANLRSAVHRAATLMGMSIETLADDKNFYVWQSEKSGD